MTDSLFDVEAFDSGSPSGDADPATEAARPASGSQNQSQSRSLYRKYRPQSFAEDELFGQRHVVNTLKNAIRLDRIGHAYLFCGPRGTGKTTTARILAKAVNCLDPDPANRPCNACDACNAINSGATTDVIEIDAASNRGIDDIRELRERVKYAPTNLQTKFYIIDEAHQITGAAANAFLKTLEEPPAHTRFVLATTDPEELLQTIVSRCQRFDFRRIDLDAMSACIMKVAGAEKIEIEPEAVTTIARHATGSLRDALGLLDQVAVYRDEANEESTTVTNDHVRAVLGISRNDRVEGLVRAIAEHDAGAALTLINEAIDAGEDARQLARQFVAYLRMLMLEAASGSSDADDVARELAGRFALGHLATMTAAFADVDYKARHVSVPQLPLELAIVRACLNESAPEATPQRAARPAPASEPSAEAQPPTPPRRKGPSLKDRVRGAAMAPAGPTIAQPPAEEVAARREPDPGPAPDPSASPTDQPAVPAPNQTAPQPTSTAPAEGGAGLEHIVDLWDNIRMDVKALNRRTEALLQQADPLRLDGGNLTLVAAYPFHQKRLNDDDTRRTIESVIERHLGTKVTINCISTDEAQAIRSQASGGSPRQAPTPAAPAARPARARAATDEEDDDSEPEPRTEPSISATKPAQESASTHAPSASLDGASNHDDARIEAAINIFDAVLIDEDES